MTHSVTRRGDFVVFSPGVDIDSSNFPELEEKVSDLIKEGNLNIILDFSQITHVDSSGIGVLIRIHRQLKEKGGRLVLAACNEHLRKIFYLVKFNEHLTITATLDEAFI